jgi:hypothetical protein
MTNSAKRRLAWRIGAGLAALRADDAATAHQDAAAQEVKFRGGTGWCVIDDYITRIGAHYFEEIACLVQGRTSASVVVAAAPAAQRAHARCCCAQSAPTLPGDRDPNTMNPDTSAPGSTGRMPDDSLAGLASTGGSLLLAVGARDIPGQCRLRTLALKTTAG